MNFNLWKLDEHPELVEALFAAHREAAIANDNASKLCVQQAWGGSGRFENAIVAGMATIGALHAPLRAARELWETNEPRGHALSIMISGERVPGFGNSFHLSDPSFNPVIKVLNQSYPKILARLIQFEMEINDAKPHLRGSLYPNAAMYTAIVASICEVPIGLEPALFAMARIPAWAEMCGAVQHPKVGGVR